MVSLRLRDIADVVDPSVSSYDAIPAFGLKERPRRAMERLRHGLYVTHRNKNLISNCDILLANFLGAGSKASIGSIGEIFWADALGKLIIIVREPTGNVHDHAMLNAIAGRVCHDLDDALGKIRELAVHDGAKTA
jgi:hypothetical protein